MRQSTHNARVAADAIKMALLNPERHPVRSGLVKNVDKAGGLIMVEILPDGGVTNWIRYLGLGISFGKWRASYLPPLETEVLLLATDPDCFSYIALGGLYNGVDIPPDDYAADTVLLEHADGNKLLLDADGTIYLGGKDDAQAVVMKSWIEDTFNALIQSLNSHTHPHPMGPTAVPTAPFQAWSDGGISTKFKGV
ncbi:hypothetical protein J7643_19145 [bacterium]|nr:hypothetical protein [bacterium]